MKNRPCMIFTPYTVCFSYAYRILQTAKRGASPHEQNKNFVHVGIRVFRETVQISHFSTNIIVSCFTCKTSFFNLHVKFFYALFQINFVCVFHFYFFRFDGKAEFVMIFFIMNQLILIRTTKQFFISICILIFCIHLTSLTLYTIDIIFVTLVLTQSICFLHWIGSFSDCYI